MRTALLLSALLVSGSFVAAPVAASDAKLDPRFEPIAFLVGHCWEADFPGGKMRDVQCFDPLFDGKLVSNWHAVEGSDPLYQGRSVFSWDDANKRVRYHYFTSTGAVSEGWFEKKDDGYVIPERHVSPDGSVIELESLYRAEGKDAYRVVTREKTQDGWVERRNMVYKQVARRDPPK